MPLYRDSSMDAMSVIDMPPPDFDYAAFLQDQDTDLQDSDYFAEESSGSSNTLAGPSTPQALVPASTTRHDVHFPSSSSNDAQPSASLSRTRLERRGHTKSRRGCFNCKRRRIKCQETRPACAHCLKTGLHCEYPHLPLVIHQPSHQIPLFSLQDMRFFQHFLLQCYPHHPLGAEHLWLHEVPCLSQEYDFLMHAILGYSASQLMCNDGGLVEPAMAHRLKAIKAVKRSLAEGGKGGEGKDMFKEGNALMATCFVLTFQSVMLEDGMVEYMTFIRGIIIVAIQMYIKGARLMFGEYLGDAPAEKLKSYMEEVPLVERRWVDGAVEGIRGLEGLVKESGREIEATYWEKLLEMGQMLYVGGYEAYSALRQHYSWWMMLPHHQFQKIVDPDNQVAILLGAHWIALKQIMATITEAEAKTRAKEPERPEVDKHDASNGIAKWLKCLNRCVDAEHVRFNAWPMWVEQELERDPACFGRTLFGH